MENFNKIRLDIILFILFLILKLTSTIDWSWWWVTAPLWIPTVLAIILWVVVCILDNLD
jgi:hypothetical protein